jgi:hypothetical protein
MASLLAASLSSPSRAYTALFEIFPITLFMPTCVAKENSRGSDHICAWYSDDIETNRQEEKAHGVFAPS